MKTGAISRVKAHRYNTKRDSCTAVDAKVPCSHKGYLDLSSYRDDAPRLWHNPRQCVRLHRGTG